MEEPWVEAVVDFDSRVRVVVSPGPGIFEPCDGISSGDTIGPGDILGHVRAPGIDHAIVAADCHEGRLVTFVAVAGERLQKWQPVAWVDSDGPG